MTSQPECTCQAAPTLVFPYSGASNVGGLTDGAARQMTLDLTGKVYCLVGTGGRVEGTMANTQAAARVLVIDGCEEERARKTMEPARLSGFAHLQLERYLGFEKGATHVTTPVSAEWQTAERNCWSAGFATLMNQASPAKP